MRAPAGAVCGVVLLGCALAVAIACQGNPAKPSPPLAGTSSWLKIEGATVLDKPGDTSALKVMVVGSDGTMKDATTVATLEVLPSGLASVKGGLLTAATYGHGTVQVTASHITQSLPLRVLPAGMFLLQGRVTGGGFPLSQALVEVSSQAGVVSALSSDFGTVALPAAGAVTIRTERFGYEETVQQVTVERDATIDIELHPRRDAASLGTIDGVYTLTFTASPSCGLPPDLMRRTWAGRVTETSPNLRVDLSAPGFGLVGWFDYGFTGQRDGAAVRFDVSGDPDALYVVIEQVQYNGNVAFLAFTGTATGAVLERRISTTFSGTVRLYSGPTTYVTCSAGDHALEFAR